MEEHDVYESVFVRFRHAYILYYENNIPIMQRRVCLCVRSHKAETSKQLQVNGAQSHFDGFCVGLRSTRIMCVVYTCKQQCTALLCTIS